MSRRRTLIKGLAGAVPLGLLAGRAASQDAVPAERPVGRNYFGELGLKPFINAAGAYSAYGGARMRPEVVAAMRYAATRKVKIRDLHDAVGQRIADLVGSEAAMVTSGATAAIVVGTAACMTRGDEQKMRQLPNTANMPDEVIVQKKHRYTYDKALTVPGARIVDVASERDVRSVISERTAMMFFLKPAQQGDNLPAAEYVALAREFNVPTFCDAATTTPPASNIVAAVQEGFDLFCYSGGKGLRGPYSAGLLLGREDLIAAARRHAAPNDLSIGRGMKVSLEEYLGMLVALETGLGNSEAEDFEWKQARFDNIIAAISDLPGVTATTFVSDGHAREMYLDIDWDTDLINMSRDEFIRALREHEPSVEVRLLQFSGGRIHLSATVMDEGEDVIVGQAVRTVLQAHT